MANKTETNIAEQEIMDAIAIYNKLHKEGGGKVELSNLSKDHKQALWRLINHESTEELYVQPGAMNLDYVFVREGKQWVKYSLYMNLIAYVEMMRYIQNSDEELKVTSILQLPIEQIVETNLKKLKKTEFFENSSFFISYNGEFKSDIKFLKTLQNTPFNKGE